MAESEIKFKQRWHQIGVELEGAWNLSRESVAMKVRGAKAVKDLSVKIGIGDPGEIITRPHANLDMLCEDILNLYPDHVHDTCGFHIHTSFSPLDGSIIASHDFYRYFKEQWEAWGKKRKLERNHEFWRRLQGTNKNARDEFLPEQQLKPTPQRNGAKGSAARYTILNFHSWEVHGTIESRLLPMFLDRQVAVDAVRQHAWIIDSYLNSHGFEELKFESATDIVGDTVVETYEMKLPDTTPMMYEAKGNFPALVEGEDVYYSIPGAEHEMLPFRKEINKQTP